MESFIFNPLKTVFSLCNNAHKPEKRDIPVPFLRLFVYDIVLPADLPAVFQFSHDKDRRFLFLFGLMKFPSESLLSSPVLSVIPVVIRKTSGFSFKIGSLMLFIYRQPRNAPPPIYVGPSSIVTFFRFSLFRDQPLCSVDSFVDVCAEVFPAHHLHEAFLLKSMHGLLVDV